MSKPLADPPQDRVLVLVLTAALAHRVSALAGQVMALVAKQGLRLVARRKASPFRRTAKRRAPAGQVLALTEVRVPELTVTRVLVLADQARALAAEQVRLVALPPGLALAPRLVRRLAALVNIST